MSWAASLVRVFLTILFLTAGGAKLIGEPAMTQAFQQWGFPTGFMYAVGVVEVVGAVMLLVPRVRRAGAGLLLIVMLGAVATHAANGEWMRVPAPTAVAIALFTVGWVPPVEERRDEELAEGGHAQPLRG